MDFDETCHAGGHDDDELHVMDMSDTGMLMSTRQLGTICTRKSFGR